MTTLAADFAEHGAHVIASVRQASPETYLRVVATIAARATDEEAATGAPVVIIRQLADV